MKPLSEFDESIPFNSDVKAAENKSYLDRYKRLATKDWYKKAYKGRSIGEIIEIK